MKLQSAFNAIIVLALLFGGITLLYKDGSFTGNSFSSCTTVTETVVTIGNEASTQVLPARSGRSWAMVQLVVDGGGGNTATNTPSIAFGSTATLVNGLKLSTTTPELVFGMDTNHPYSGIVSAITDNGSTTVGVSECR